MRRWSRTNSGRLIRKSPSPPLNMADIGVENFSEHENDQALQAQFLKKILPTPQNKFFQKKNHHIHSKIKRNPLPMLG